MTACLLIQPQEVPALAADIVRLSASEPDVRPIINMRQSHAIGEIHYHVRKIYHVSRNTAIAFATEDEQKIIELLDDLTGHVHHFENSLYPAYDIGEWLGDYPDISVLISSARVNILGYQGNFIYSLDKVDSSDTYKSDNYGSCHAIGKGRRRLLGLARKFDNIGEEVAEKCRQIVKKNGKHVAFLKLSEEDLIKSAALTITESVAQSLLDKISQYILMAEFNGEPREDHGGFLEYSMFDLATATWKRREAHVSLFYEVHDKDNVKMWPNILAYDPGQYFGEILVFDSARKFHRHLLEDVRKPLDRTNPPESLFWKGWRPLHSTVYLLRKQRNGQFKWCSVNIEGVDLEQIQITVNEEGTSFCFGLSKQIFEKIIMIPFKSGDLDI